MITWTFTISPCMIRARAETCQKVNFNFVDVQIHIRFIKRKFLQKVIIRVGGKRPSLQLIAQKPFRSRVNPIGGGGVIMQTRVHNSSTNQLLGPWPN